MSMFLAIETSGAVGSVALAAGARTLERSIATPREQTELLLPLIDELLAEAELTLAGLDAIVFGRGPGSFTGLRIATAIAQGLALAAGLPVIAVSSLAAVAERAWTDAAVERALVAIDARMGEVYWGCFEASDGLAQAAGPERITAPEAVIIPPWRHWTALGGAFTAHAGALARVAAEADAVIADIAPRARDLLPLAAAEWAAGRAVAAVDARPTYLRDDSAWQRSSS